MSTLTSVFRFYRLGNSTKSLYSNTRTLFTSNSCFNDKDDNDDDKKKEKKIEAEKKLKELLQTMLKAEPASESAKKIQIPRPRVEAQKQDKERKTEFFANLEKQEKEKIGSRLADAASQVANTLGGDTKKTEMELLDLYLGQSHTGETSETQQSDEETKKASQMNIKDLISSMKVEKAVPREQSRAHQVQAITKHVGAYKFPKKVLSKTRSGVNDKVNILGDMPLGIFTTDDEDKKGVPAENVVWDYLQKRDVHLSVTHPPANIFEQFILWTEQGKIWKFPIDNEQDWKEEEDVDFTEHVFLEHLIEPWCPSSGPIRHFMELVCVGLSKNPYLRVAEKYAHICFYEHYFRNKNHILIELGLDPIKDRSELEPEQQQQEVAA